MKKLITLILAVAMILSMAACGGNNDGGSSNVNTNLDFEDLEKNLNLPKNGTFSDIYLGATVLEMLGYTGQDAYFDFLNYARRELPVFKEKENAYLLGDGSVITELSETQKEIIHKIDWWEYYRLRDK